MSTKKYITDGLILYYDGKKRTRQNKSVGKKLIWEDLSGNGNDAVFYNDNKSIIYKDNGFEFTNNNDYIESINPLNLSKDPDVTFEFVYQWYGKGNNTLNGIFYMGSSNASTGRSISGFISDTNNLFYFSIMNFGMKSKNKNDYLNEVRSITFSKNSGKFSTTSNIFLNGSLLTDFTTSGSNIDLENTSIKIGRGWQWDNANRSFNGIIYAVRVYDRKLTADEVKNNYEIDKVRYKLKG